MIDAKPSNLHLPTSGSDFTRTISPRMSSAVLARNATLNLLTEGFLFVILVVSTPFLVARLGVQSFGLYALAWSLIGYLAYLEFGVSRSATQFVSKYLSQENRASVLQAATTSILSNLLIGLGCGIVVLLLTPMMVRRAFHIPLELEGQARLVFYSVALAVPLVMLQAVFRAIAASYQAFGKINLVNAAGTALQYALACLLAWRGFGVGAVVFSTVIIRLAFLVCYAILAFHLLPGLLRLTDFDRNELRTLFRFGGWVTASQLVLQMLMYLDRILLASLVSLSAVTLFIVPFEALTRLRVIPASVMATVYPAMTEATVEPGRGKLQALYENSVRYLLFLLLPLICFLAVFGKDLLTLWMGAAFAAKSAIVFEILAVGFLLNSLAYVSYHAIQAVERPGIVGKYHLVALPFYVGLSFVLVYRWGIAGAAVAASVRFGLDAVVLFWVARQYAGCSMLFVRHSNTLRIILLGAVLAAVFVAARFTVTSPWLRFSLGLFGIGSYFLLAWRFLLTSREKPALVRALGLSRI